MAAKEWSPVPQASPELESARKMMGLASRHTKLLAGMCFGFIVLIIAITLLFDSPSYTTVMTLIVVLSVGFLIPGLLCLYFASGIDLSRRWGLIGSLVLGCLVTLLLALAVVADVFLLPKSLPRLIVDLIFLAPAIAVIYYCIRSLSVVHLLEPRQ